MRRCIIIIVLPALLFTSGCIRCRNSRSQASDADRFPEYAWNMDQVKSYFHITDAGSESFKKIICSGIYRNVDSCGGYIQLNRQIVFKDTKEDIAKVFRDSALAGQLKSMVGYLYTVIPELFVDTDSYDDKSFNYAIGRNNLLEKIDQAKQGKIAAFCGDNCRFVKSLWEYHYPEQNSYSIFIHSMYVDSGDNVNHTVCLFQFKTDTGSIATVVDPMFGYIFPVNADNSLVSLKQVSDALGKNICPWQLNFVDDSVLNHKRFLTNMIWPCNLVDESYAGYYKAPGQALRKYELHEKEHLLWLYPCNYDETKYEKTLLKILKSSLESRD